MSTTDRDERTLAAVRTSGRNHPGPPLAFPAGVFVAAFLAAILAGPVSGAGTTPSPFDGGVGQYYAAHRTVTATSAWLLILSAVALLFLSALLYSRLTFLAPNAPGPAIAGTAGVVAAALLAVSGCVAWVLSRPELGDHAALLHLLDFALGGPAHTAALGLSVLGTAVTLLFVRRTPRLLSIVGIVIAGISLLSTLTLVAPALAPVVPLGRDAAMLWLLVLSFLIPRGRAARRVRTEP